MSFHPNCSFPLCASDQADVIRIFLDLMTQGDLAGHTSQVKTNQQVRPCTDSHDAWVQGELPDHD